MNLQAREYEDEGGRSRFGRWFASLDSQAAARVTRAIRRMELGNFSSAKPIGEGVHECSIDTGPGYRIYFGKHGKRLLLLLGGGTKRRQQADIDQAKADWKAFKRREKEGSWH